MLIQGECEESRTSMLWNQHIQATQHAWSYREPWGDVGIPGSIIVPRLGNFGFTAILRAVLYYLRSLAMCFGSCGYLWALV